MLRNREAIVQAELDRVKTRLRREKDRLEWLKHQLTRSLNVLRRRLVSIYRSDEPDVLTVMLEADGFEDLVSRYEYLRRIEEQDADIVMFLHRPEAYDPEDRPGEADLIVAKNRNGPVGEVTLAYVKQYLRYEDFKVGTPFDG